MAVDHRFYRPLGARSLGELARLSGARPAGPDLRLIDGLASAGSAGPSDICFLDGGTQRASPVSKTAGGCFVREADAAALPGGVPALVCEFPRHAHALAGAHLFERRRIDAQAEPVSPGARLGEGVILGPGVVIGPGAVIGAGSRLGPYAVIGPGVHVGRGCDIGSHVSIACALIGDHVTILSGTRIGEDGFGLMPGPDGMLDAPHFGRAIVQDHVSLGANCCVDRGAFDDTVIAERAKIDNFCQIAHNCHVGRGVMIAAYGGLSGSVRIGDYARLGGRVGVADHVTIGEGASLAAMTGVFRDVPAGEAHGGQPARPVRQWLRETAWLQRQARAIKPGS